MLRLLAALCVFAVHPAIQQQLIFSDEFNGNSLDRNKWNIEQGYLNVNNEKENYQPGNVQVTGGNLVITAKRQQMGNQQYTSGRINTQNKFSFTFGRAEARIKLPKVQGLWPAFWMLGNSISQVGWPKCGEIDIMEQINTENRVFGTLHWFHNGHAQYGLTTNIDNTAGWHVYAVEWDTNNIRVFVDGRQYFVMDIKDTANFQQFKSPFYLILNLAVGGDLPGQTINDGALPAQMLVDYVRVYGKGGSPPPPPPPSGGGEVYSEPCSVTCTNGGNTKECCRAHGYSASYGRCDGNKKAYCKK
ncbi:hypothetical protein AAVH_36074 [Aphelenchoides avenae]|nr:hypothetical protein AAVH_36074 [Aphelenchus avenae]